MNQKNPDIHKRSRILKHGQRGNGPVVYWMSRDQRMIDNWALLWAQQEAIVRNKELIVIFCLVPKFLDASSKHYSFMMDGLKETKVLLEKNNTPFLLFRQEPQVIIPPFLKKIDAHLLVTDFDPLRIKQQWKEAIKRETAVPVAEVDTHNIVPVWTVSDKKEYAAYTIRPKINRLLDEFLTDIPEFRPHPTRYAFSTQLLDVFGNEVINLDDHPKNTDHRMQAGEHAASQRSKMFIDENLLNYNNDSNNPCLNGQSGLSPYFHFGHLSAQRVAFDVSKTDIPEELKEGFLEELIIRKELSDNFCYYEKNYDQFSAFPNWAQKSLNIHRKERRDYTYSFDQLENGLTHEPLWNACQKDLVKNGKLHGYLRMYWAKKILEWTTDPETALAHAIKLNDRYSLDGRDPNGYTGVAWSIGGVHDRAWKERPVFGKVRYMNEKGCRRKFNVEEYIRSVCGENNLA